MQKRLIALVTAVLLLPGCANAQPTDDLIPALEQLAIEGNPEAVYHIGMAYQTGAGVGRDAAKALEAFRRAADLGDVLGSYKLGCFYDGQGEGLVPNDPELALQHKLVAAEAGYALAQQDVAALYAAKGEIGKAVEWLERAMLQGWADALATYASVHNGAEGVEPDPVRTAAYFRLFLARTEASEDQRAWLDEFEEKMSPEQQRRAAEIVRTYQPAPTPITLKALAGQRAALELLARAS